MPYVKYNVVYVH